MASFSELLKKNAPGVSTKWLEPEKRPNPHLSKRTKTQKPIHPRKWAAASPKKNHPFLKFVNHLSTIDLHDFLGFNMWIFQDVCAVTYQVLLGFWCLFSGIYRLRKSVQVLLLGGWSALDPVVRIIPIYKPWSRGSDSGIGDYDCHAY